MSMSAKEAEAAGIHCRCPQCHVCKEMKSSCKCDFSEAQQNFIHQFPGLAGKVLWIHRFDNNQVEGGEVATEDITQACRDKQVIIDALVIAFQEHAKRHIVHNDEFNTLMDLADRLEITAAVKARLGI